VERHGSVQDVWECARKQFAQRPRWLGYCPTFRILGKPYRIAAGNKSMNRWRNCVMSPSRSFACRMVLYALTAPLRVGGLTVSVATRGNPCNSLRRMTYAMCPLFKNFAKVVESRVGRAVNQIKVPYPKSPFDQINVSYSKRTLSSTNRLMTL
jgi:hypothetical protein